MISLMLFIVAIVVMYVTFFITYWLGSGHWAFYPTIVFGSSLIIIHLIGAWLKLKDKKK